MRKKKIKGLHRMIGATSLLRNELLSIINDKKAPNIIISDFRRDVGEIPDIISFQREFIGRNILSDKQIEAYHAVWGEKGGEWSTKFHEIVLLVGMKGGKNFWAEGDLAYLCLLYSALLNPHAFFSKITKRIVPYTNEKNFDIINVSSVGEQQARNAFFESSKNVICSTTDPRTGENWFEKYAGLDISEKSRNIKKNSIVFPTNKNGSGCLRLLSFNSSPRSPEGLHMLRFYADELSRADTLPQYSAAKALYILGLNNTRVSFPNYVGKVIGWSYPSETDYDITYERYEKSLTVDSIFGLHAKTVEFNPSFPKELIEKERVVLGSDYERVYECKKIVSRDNFFHPYTGKIDEMISPEIENRVNYSIVETPRTVDQGSINEKTYNYTSAEILDVKKDCRIRCFAFDPSSNRDRFVIVGGYPEVIDTNSVDTYYRDGKRIKISNIRPVIDIIIVIDPKPDRPIDAIGIGKVFTRLINAFTTIHSFNSDKYQSDKLRQEIEKEGIISKSYNFSQSEQRELYTKLKRNVWNNNIKICKDTMLISVANKEISVTDLLRREAHQLIDFKNRIDHPRNGSKDILDAIAILNHDIMSLESIHIDYEIASLNGNQLHKLSNKFHESMMVLREKDRYMPKEKLIKEISKITTIPEHLVAHFYHEANEDHRYR